MLRFNDFIQCPNLKCFIAGWTRDEVWEMPPWVPLSFSELKLDGMAFSKFVLDVLLAYSACSHS